MFWGINLSFYGLKRLGPVWSELAMGVDRRQQLGRANEKHDFWEYPFKIFSREMFSRVAMVC